MISEEKSRREEIQRTSKALSDQISNFLISSGAIKVTISFAAFAERMLERDTFWSLVR